MSSRIFVSAVIILGCGPACTPDRKRSGPPPQQEERHTGIIGGAVVNQRGQPVADVTVSVFPMEHSFVGVAPSDRTGPKGKFQVARLTWGKYEVCAHKEADGYREICNNVFTKDSAPTLTLSPQAPIASVQVTIGPKAGTLTGTIKDSVTGLPVNPITDAVTGARQAPVLRITPSTDNVRYFDQAIGPQFTALIPPDADLELEVRAPGYRSWRFSLHDGRRGTPFRMKSGEKRTLHIQLRPDLQ
jgi:hypothetical protein